MSDAENDCPRCGATLRPQDEACPFCGHQPGGPGPEPLVPPEIPPPESRGPWAVGAADPAASGQATAPTPWEDRSRFGIAPALWLTWRESVFRPVPFFRRLPPRGRLGAALSYLLSFVLLGAVAGYYWGYVEALLAGGYAGGEPLLGVQHIFALLARLVVLLPIYLALLFAATAMLHLGYRIAGAGGHGLEATFRAVSYAHGPAAFALFPFFGSWVAMIWGGVLVFIGTREIQRTTNGRAAAAFVLPVAAALLLLLFLVILISLLIDPTELGLPA